MLEFEQTSFETDPVESRSDALRAFVQAYDVLQSVLEDVENSDENEENRLFADKLRKAVYRPVRPHGYDVPPISLYEIGVVYVPDEIGKYSINERKLDAALGKREDEIRALFVQEDGILPHLCEILPEFLKTEKLHELTYMSALRFLNECRRLTAMFD